MEKSIKKFLLCMLSAVILLFMPSCVGEYKFIHGTDNWNDVKIEIVEIEGWIDSTYYTTTPYNDSFAPEKIIIIAEIKEDKIEFIQELQSLASYEAFGTPIGTIGGKAICITYPDSEIELITHYGSALVTDVDVSVHTKTFDEEQFNAFWEKWSVFE